MTAANRREDFIAGLVRHLDIAEHQLVVVLLKQTDRLCSVGGRGDIDVILAQHVADGQPDVRLIIRNQHMRAGEDRISFVFDIGCAENCGVGTFGGLLQEIPDRSHVVKNLLKLGAQIVLTDVVAHQRAGIGTDVVEGTGDFRANIIGNFVAGLYTLDDHQI
jgi:hypothetical protein